MKDAQNALQYYDDKAYKAAFLIFKDLSQEGYAEPAFMVGRMYCKGKYTGKSSGNANKYFKKAGSSCTCSKIGNMKCDLS